MVKLLKVLESKKNGKKFDAYFMLDNGKEKVVSFGSKNYRDYTLINNKSSKFYLPKKVDRNIVKEAYIRRHKERENWNNPLTAGALSRWILWELPTLGGSIAKFKNKFKLN
tara:strand:- start:390 stop:722 length:333 start_codon:yes stop_codon:yes gene_type:complete